MIPQDIIDVNHSLSTRMVFLVCRKLTSPILFSTESRKQLSILNLQKIIIQGAITKSGVCHIFMVNIGDMEGWLNKKGRMTWKRRYFSLSGNTMSYYAKKGDAKFRGQMTLIPQVGT